MFLSSIRQKANAKITTNTCHRDAIVIEITKKLDVTAKNE